MERAATFRRPRRARVDGVGRAGIGRRPRARPRGLTLAAVVTVALLAACTDEEPDELPAPELPPAEEGDALPFGQEVELVLPAADAVHPAVLAALDRRLSAAVAEPPDGVSRVAIRQPPNESFVGDLVEAGAARGAGLVCALGPDVRGVLDRTADRHPASTLCGLGIALPEPDEEGDLPELTTVPVDLPVEALGRLVGIGARSTAELRAAAAGEEEDDEAAAPVVGLVLSGDDVPAGRFRDGLLLGLAGIEVVEAEDEDAGAAETVEAVLGAGAQVVVIDGGPGADEALDAVGDRAAVVAPVDVLAARSGAGEGGLTPDDTLEVALAYRLGWEVAVTAVVDRLATGGGLEAGIVLGAADDVAIVEVDATLPVVAGVVSQARVEMELEDDPGAPLPDGASPLPNDS